MVYRYTNEYTHDISDEEILLYVDEPLELKVSSKFKISGALNESEWGKTKVYKARRKRELEKRIRLFKLANRAMEMYLRLPSGRV